MADDDLAPSSTTGYKVGEKKTLEELAKLDQQDESLRKWKESLGLKADAQAGSSAGSGDARKVIVLSLGLEVEGRPDIVIDISNKDAIKKVEETVFTIKEGVQYRLKVTFRIQHDVVSGLKYLHAVKRGPLRVDKMEEMVGSYGPNAEPYVKKFPLEEAPSGMMARGTYVVKSRFIDDDNNVHLEWTWQFAIKKEWDE